MPRFRAGFFIVLSLVTVTAHGALTTPGRLVSEATGPSGAVVLFNTLVRVTGGGDGSDGRPADTVTCSPASGSLFAIGTTMVSCTGSEGSTGSFDVAVVDTTAPHLTIPFDFTIVTQSTAGQVVSFNASAVDIVDGSVAVSCSPASGSTFSPGMTNVACTASDSHGNVASGHFTVTLVTSTPPPGSPKIVAEATGPDGAHVTFNTGDSEDDLGRVGSGGCSPAPGSIFPLGDTTVACPSGSFVVRVVDTTPPALSLPAGIKEVAIDASGAPVTFGASANDLVDGSVEVLCSPPSGSTFPIGTTRVTCSASDTRGNTATGNFDVDISATPLPPQNPHDITAEATGPAGAVVTFNLGNDSGGRPITCSPASGSTFPIAATPVTCSSGDTFTVTVVDTTPPVLTLPANITAEANAPFSATVTFTTSATDLVDGPVSVTCTPPSGSSFNLGTTAVSCSATDAHGNTSNGSFTVHVVDTTPPVIASISVSPATIWPPNGNLVDVTVTVHVTDVADPSPLVKIIAITCNEPIGPSDASITGNLTARLRADRDGLGNGRVYTLLIQATDASGNASKATVTVTVPHDQSDKRRAAGH
jgi:HYR domain-containing protein